MIYTESVCKKLADEFWANSKNQEKYPELFRRFQIYCFYQSKAITENNFQRKIVKRVFPPHNSKK